MNILITGISGFVGNYLARYLLEKNNRNAVFGTYLEADELNSLSDIKDNIKLYRCNIKNEKSVWDVVNKVKPDQVYHLAGAASGAEEDRKLVFSVNVDGTMNLLRSLKDQHQKVKVLLASTSYVYGSSPDCEPFVEENEANPIGIYAESKLEMEEKACKYLSNNVGVVITRAFNHTGPGQTDRFVVPAFAKQIAEIEKKSLDPLIKVGNLEAIRDFLDVRDVVRAYDLVMNNADVGEVYNIASGKGIKIQEVLDNLLKMSEVKISTVVDKDRLRPSDIECSVGSYKKIKKDFKWNPKIDFKETLKLTLDYWRSKI